MFDLKKIKSFFTTFKIIKTLILGFVFFTLSFLIYLYYYSIPEQVAIELIGINNLKISKVDVCAESFLNKAKNFELQPDNRWIAQTGFIRNISIKIPDSIYFELSHISISIGNTVFKIDKNKFGEKALESNIAYRRININQGSVLRGNFFKNFGLINYKFRLKLFIRSIFDVLCFTILIYAIVLSIRILRRKKKQNVKLEKVISFSIIPLKHLVFFSVLILLLPWFVFIGGYLKIQFSLIIISILLVALFVLFKKIYVNNSENSYYSIKHIIIVVIITSVFIFLSGIGGLGLQNNDWVKHNFILSDLINHSWPVIYDYNLYENSEVGGSALIYYTGFYILPAVFGKLFGWSFANIVMIIQSFSALFLIFCWVIYFAGNKKNAILTIFIFLIFSGADIIGHLFNFDTFLYFTSPLYTDSLNIQFTSNMSQLFWIPQHCFGAWLGMSLIIYFIKDNRNYFIGLLMFAISFLWSVYIAICLIPFLVFYGLKYFIPILNESKRNILIIISAVLLFIIEILYFSSKSAKIEILHYGYNMDFIFLIINLCEFALIEWLLIFIIILKIQNNISTNSMHRNKSISFNLLFLAASILFIIPLIPFVSVWDFIARSSLPALFVLAILLIKSFVNNTTSLKYKSAIILILAIGAFAPINEVQRSISYLANDGINFPPKVNERSTIPLLAPRYTVQYMGNENSFFFRYLCKSNNENQSK